MEKKHVFLGAFGLSVVAVGGFYLKRFLDKKSQPETPQLTEEELQYSEPLQLEEVPDDKNKPLIDDGSDSNSN